VVLGTAFGITSGVVVDTHVSRISQRLGLTKQTDPVKIELDLQKLLPRDHWIRYCTRSSRTGAVCDAKPKCGECAGGVVSVGGGGGVVKRRPRLAPAIPGIVSRV
jgi:endonuclease-3